jgi:Protein of unknown function (DUF3467)
MAETTTPVAPEPSMPGLDASQLDSIYANFCRVTGMPEEVIIDFGLTTDPHSPGDAAIKGSERVILSFYTAKRLLDALALTVSRHESAFGTLEVNAEKRTIPGWRG